MVGNMEVGVAPSLGFDRIDLPLKCAVSPGFSGLQPKNF